MGLALCGTGSTARLVPNRGKASQPLLYESRPTPDVIGLVEKNLAYYFVL
jgi:hypothetical protein